MCRCFAFVFGAALAAVSAFVLPSAGRGDVSPAVMFWNVECLFDPFDDPLHDDEEYTPAGKRHWTWKQFCQKCGGVAKTIAASSQVWGRLPDIVGLAEVENRMAVASILKGTVLEEAGYGIVHRESPDRRGIDVALLYRRDVFRVLSVDSLRVASTRPTRDILYVKGLYKQSDTLHLLVNHWPSKLGGAQVSDAARKVAAATMNACADSILAASPGAFVLAMGDFNDTPANVVPLVTPALHSLSGPLVQRGAGTLKYKGEWELIDQFFCSDTSARMEIFAPVFLLETDRTYTGMKPRRTFVGPRNNGGLSDHLPILLKP